MKNNNVENLKIKALAEYEKVCEHKSKLSGKLAELEAERSRIVGTSKDRNEVQPITRMSLDSTEPEPPKSLARVLEEINGYKRMLEADPFTYEEYRNATKEYLTALEPLFTKETSAIQEEKRRIKEERQKLDELEEELEGREFDVDVYLDGFLMEVGCNSAIFPIERDAETNRKLFLARLNKFEALA